MPVTCNRIWAPWKRGSRIFGTSAAAIQIVAKQYGYQMVELMAIGLDVFLVRQDILNATCINADSLPTFEWMAEGVLGLNMHSFCEKKEARERLVDFSLALEGRDEEASKKAMDYVRELNEAREKLGESPFCRIDS
jgi:hypothetical protein